LVSGDAVGVLTPILGAASATCFLAAAYLLWRRTSNRWFAWLIVAGAILSLPLQVIWFSIWAIPPIVVDIVLLWSMLGGDVTVDGLTRPAATN
jgi:uncharacterized membrane protein YbaN (DUF454 family)